MVVMRIQLDVNPDRPIRIFHDDKFICELPIKLIQEG
jgi:hypothetical protein